MQPVTSMATPMALTPVEYPILDPVYKGTVTPAIGSTVCVQKLKHAWRSREVTVVKILGDHTTSAADTKVTVHMKNYDPNTLFALQTFDLCDLVELLPGGRCICDKCMVLVSNISFPSVREFAPQKDRNFKSTYTEAKSKAVSVELL